MNISKKALHLIFWGIILIIIDIHLKKGPSSAQLKIDFFNNIIGGILVLRGVLLISKIKIDHIDYTYYIRAAILAYSIEIILGIFDFISISVPYWFTLLQLFLFLLAIYGQLMLCKALRVISEKANIPSLIKNWKITERLITYINLIPYFIFFIICIIALLNDRFLNNTIIQEKYPFISIFFIIISFIPTIYMLWTILQMKNKTNLINQNENNTK